MKNEIAILLPCYNEQDIIQEFLDELVLTLKLINQGVSIILVNDSSSDNTIEKILEFKSSHNCTDLDIRILNLEYNVGHQKAIKVGLKYLEDQNYKKVVIMDSDGEDDPSAIQELVKFNDFDIIHVARGKRKEKFSFVAYYRLYKLLFYFITNTWLDFGNYCMINKKALAIINKSSFVNFPAFLSRLKLKKKKIRYDRRNRIGGNSKMRWKGLVYHGIFSYVEYAEDLLFIFIRLFISSTIILFFIIFVLIYLRFYTDFNVPGWTSIMILSLLNLSVLSIGFFVLGVILLKIGKTNENSYPTYEVL